MPRQNCIAERGGMLKNTLIPLAISGLLGNGVTATGASFWHSRAIDLAVSLMTLGLLGFVRLQLNMSAVLLGIVCGAVVCQLVPSWLFGSAWLRLATRTVRRVTNAAGLGPGSIESGNPPARRPRR